MTHTLAKCVEKKREMFSSDAQAIFEMLKSNRNNIYGKIKSYIRQIK